ncbi:hypothetical protein [Paraburkholderia sediminicola]|uniref:hypothetical protein n=1 Tax=Paraburkholderia sediminicola TaxID=458836 RepID=UPI0038BD7583
MALRTGATTGDIRIDTLTHVVREAAANSGSVTDSTWNAARQTGWSDEHLTEAFAFLGADDVHGILPHFGLKAEVNARIAVRQT